jgi:hypothetical protein
MLKYVPFLLLALAVGCSQPDAPVGSADNSVSNDAPETIDMALPPATATLVKFTCPGMT